MKTLASGVPEHTCYPSTNPQGTVEWLVTHAGFHKIRGEGDGPYFLSKEFTNGGGGHYQFIIEINLHLPGTGFSVPENAHIALQFSSPEVVDDACKEALDSGAQPGRSNRRDTSEPYWAIVIVPGGFAIQLIWRPTPLGL